MWKTRIFSTFSIYSKNIENIDFLKLENKKGLFYVKNTNKLFTGKALKYCPNGRVSDEKYFKTGKLGGKEKAWYCDGKKKKTAYYYKYHKVIIFDKSKEFDKFIISNSDKAGKEVLTLWDKYNDKFEISYYDGKFIMWFNNGVKEVEASYKKGLLNGKYLSRWSTNKKKDQIYYINGKQHGQSLGWYKSGKLSDEMYYEYGKLTKEYKEWYENGKLKIKGVYKKGKKNGLFTEYDKNGKLNSKKVYRNDKVIKDYNIKVENKNSCKSSTFTKTLLNLIIKALPKRELKWKDYSTPKYQNRKESP